MASQSWKTIDIIYIGEVVLIMIMNIWGLYLLQTEKKRRTMNCMLIHLSLSEMLYTLWVCIYNMINWKGLNQHLATVIILILEVNLYLSIITLTLDRVLAVKLSLKYKGSVTKGRILVVLGIITIISVSHIICYLFNNPLSMLYTLISWEIFLLVLIVICYTYIFVKVSRGKRCLRRASARSCRRQQLNFKVPFSIVLTAFCFLLLPDMFAMAGKKWLWARVIRNLNPLCDPIIYIFGSNRIRLRLRSFCCHGTLHQNRSYRSTYSKNSRKHLMRSTTNTIPLSYL